MLFPIGDDNSDRRTTPYVVYGLIAANVLVFLVQMAAGDRFTGGYAAVPYEITHGTDLTNVVPIATPDGTFALQQYPGPAPIYLTLLTSMFMHGSLMHIAGNMLYLWIFGDQVEDLLGHLRFLAFYLLCGLIADAAHIALDPNSMIPTLGASGAIAGVLGAYLVKYPTRRVNVLVLRSVVQMPSLIVLGLWFVLQVVSQLGGAGGGVAFMAHIGGFVAGMGLVFVFGIGRKPEATERFGGRF